MIESRDLIRDYRAPRTRTGRRALLAVIQVIGVREISLRVRVCESAVYKWSEGRWQPSTRARVALELHCGIPRALWGVESTSQRRL